MEEYQQRLLDERLELTAKINALQEYLSKIETGVAVDNKLVKYLMNKQIDAMCEYNNVLEARLDLEFGYRKKD